MFNPRRRPASGAVDPATGTATDERKRDLKPLLRLWPFVRPHGWRIAGAGIALIIGAVSTLVLGAILRSLIDHGFNEGNEGYLDRALLLMLAAIAFMALAAYMRMYLGTWLGERLVADLRKSLFRHLLSLDMAFYETAKTGAVVSRITADTTLLQSVVTTSAPIALRQFMTLIGGLALLLYTSLKLTALVLVVVPIVVGSIIVFGRRVRSLSRTTRDRVADIGAYVSEMLNAIATVQAFSRERTAGREFAHSAERTFNTSVDYARVRALLTAFVMLVVFASIGIILWIGGREVFAGKMSAGDLAAFIFYSTVVAGAVGSISEIMAELQRGSAAIDRIQGLLDVKPGIAPPAAPVTLPAPKGAIEFDAVEFRYPTRLETPALTNFCLTVEPGETVALVGPSGAGKTTVFQLLLRFYDPQQGAIRIDGVDLKSCEPQALRTRISAGCPGSGHLLDDCDGEHPLWPARGDRRRGADCGGGRQRRRLHRGAARRLRDISRRTRCSPLRRPAPAYRHRSGHPAQPSYPAARRGNLGAGRGERARRPGCVGPADAGAHHPGHCAPLGDRSESSAHRRHGAWRHRRRRHPQ
jgi:ATP-binding cassette subfamily B protein